MKKLFEKIKQIKHWEIYAVVIVVVIMAIASGIPTDRIKSIFGAVAKNTLKPISVAHPSLKTTKWKKRSSLLQIAYLPGKVTM